MQGVTVAQQHDARATLCAVVANGNGLAVVITAAPLGEDVVCVPCSATESRLDVGGHGTGELMHGGAAD